jgi:hypothetical protein
METTPPTTPEGEVKKKNRSRNEDGEKALKKTGSAIRLRVERDSSKERDKSEKDKSDKKKKKKDKSSSSSSSKSSKSREKEKDRDKDKDKEKDKEKERDPEKKKRKGSRSSPSKGRSRSSTKEKEKDESGTTPPSSPKSSSSTTSTSTLKKDIDEEEDDEYDTSDDESSEEESPITHILMNSVSLPRLTLRKKEFVDPEADPRRFVRQLLLTPPRPRATEPLESPPSPPSQPNGRGRSSPELKGTQTLLDEDERERTLSRRRAHTSLVRPKFLDQLAKDNLIDAGPLVGSGEDIERRQNVFRAVHRRSKSETFLHTWDYSYIDFWDAYEYDKGMRSGDAYGTNANIEVSPLITKREIAAVSTSEMPIERRAVLLKEELEAAFKFSSSTIGKHIGYSREGKVETGSINGLLAELLGYNTSNSTFVRQFLLSCPYFVEDPCLIIDKLLDV